jgi:hypothetical protein
MPSARLAATPAQLQRTLVRKCSAERLAEGEASASFMCVPYGARPAARRKFVRSLLTSYF